MSIILGLVLLNGFNIGGSFLALDLRTLPDRPTPNLSVLIYLRYFSMPFEGRQAWEAYV